MAAAVVVKVEGLRREIENDRGEGAEQRVADVPIPSRDRQADAERRDYPEQIDRAAQDAELSLVGADEAARRVVDFQTGEWRGLASTDAARRSAVHQCPQLTDASRSCRMYDATR